MDNGIIELSRVISHKLVLSEKAVETWVINNSYNFLQLNTIINQIHHNKVYLPTLVDAIIYNKKYRISIY